tara:strand:+ start:634 stop:3246 length:2613 start_codon:yes stop_codon:yes gene_type:complete
MKKRIISALLVMVPWLLCQPSLGGEVANPDTHPYADPATHREGYAHAGAVVNEARVYDFYQRQADFYMAMPPQERPALLPAHPGLDAGLHGHWGKHNQNQHKDGRWNEVEIGSIISHVTRGNPKELDLVVKGINVKLGDGIAACFDPESLNYRAIWDGWLSFNPFRWGSSRNTTITGTMRFAQKDPIPLEDGRYLGLYRHGDRVIFHYRAGEVEILDSPGVRDGEFVRTVEVISAGGRESLPELPGPAPEYGELAQFTQGGEPAWSETVKTEVIMGASKSSSAYVVDTLVVPYENPYKSVMQLTGIAFGSDDTLYVSTLVGEIWSIKEDPAQPNQLIWKRFASGLNSPFGLHCDEDGLFALERGQILRFHDLNDDGEVDYYESYANDFRDQGKSHTHTFGLHRTADGAFHFTQKEQIMRTSPDRVTREVGYGIRNGMGIGGSTDYFWIGPQEGTWTPASSIIEVEEGNYYGLPRGNEPNPISAPICFIPRGIDNSNGGFLEITSDRWGPFQGSHVGLSFGACSHYLILRDAEGPKPQAATVPLEGEFLAGVVRGAFRESDGQLYVVGLDGWGDYSLEDGCLHRVRYTGGEVHKPSAFQVFENGIRIDFPMSLDQEAATQVSNYLAQTWEYVFSKGYGSPEYSANSDQVGHDVVEIASVHPLENPNSIFVEIPELEPTMVLYLRMHLKTGQGAPFKTDLFASTMYPQPYFGFEGAMPPREGKSTEIALRIKSSKPGSKRKQTGEVIEGARELVVNAISGLRYEQTLLEVNPREPIALKFVNKDVMPHNLVIVAPGATEKVGMASFKMLNDPEAGEKNYAPDLPEVRLVVPVIAPNQAHTLYFRAPGKKGDYPYLCTFPGHWQAMQGILRVR